MIREYYYLTKPGLVYGNALSGIAGYFVAWRGAGQFEPGRFAAMAVGLCLVMAASLVTNNIIDRGLDQRMSRTKKRALVTGKISPLQAGIYALVLLGVGGTLLGVWTNLLALGCALFGFFAYVVLYGIGKRKTAAGTLIGSISGSVPPVVGYTALSGRLDLGALLLFLLLVCWQMPHFYGIALYRIQDYKAAKLPVLPIRRGTARTERSTLFFIALYIGAALALTLCGYTGWLFGAANMAAGAYWLTDGLLARQRLDAAAWGRRVFGLSLLVLLLLSVTLVGDTLLYKFI